MFGGRAMSDSTYYVYILASRPRGTLYVGVTNSLLYRIAQHRAAEGGVFTRRYRVHQLVWFEPHDSIDVAIQREKSLKLYPRTWKVNLIERDNPHWTDLYPGLLARHGAPTPRLAERWVLGTRPRKTLVGVAAASLTLRVSPSHRP